MRTYYIMRHGSNSANQSMCPEMLVGYIDAKSLAWANKEKFNQGISLYHNQTLSLWTKTDLIRKYGKKEALEKIECLQEDMAIAAQSVDGNCNLCGKFIGKMTVDEAMNAYCGCQI